MFGMLLSVLWNRGLPGEEVGRRLLEASASLLAFDACRLGSSPAKSVMIVIVKD